MRNFSEAVKQSVALSSEHKCNWSRSVPRNSMPPLSDYSTVYSLNHVIIQSSRNTGFLVNYSATWIVKLRHSFQGEDFLGEERNEWNIRDNLYSSDCIFYKKEKKQFHLGCFITMWNSSKKYNCIYSFYNATLLRIINNAIRYLKLLDCRLLWRIFMYENTENIYNMRKYIGRNKSVWKFHFIKNINWYKYLYGVLIMN